MINRILVCLCLLAGLANAQWRSGFYWSLTGQAQKSDSIRYIQGSNITLTQSGNTLTIAGAAGAGSTASVRANVGWTASGTLARDTLYTNYAIFGAKTFGVGGTTQAQNARAKFNVLGRAANDTLAIWSNDGGGVVGDSAIFILGNGSIKSGANYLNVTSQYGIKSGNLLFENVTGLRGSNYGQVVDIMGQTGGIAIVSENSKNIRLTPAAQLLIGASTKSSQAYTTINSNGTADTTFMARNDKNSTLDSTMMVFANGRILRRDTKALPAGAWLATASNGAALSSSNYMVTYAFDTATAETLTVDFALPPNFIQISNVEIEVVSPNTDGDSVGFAIAWLGRAADEAFNVAFSSPLSGQIDLGTTANVRKILTISGTFDNLAASDRLIFKLWRDPSVDNDVAADVHLVDVRVNGNGLLY